MMTRTFSLFPLFSCHCFFTPFPPPFFSFFSSIMLKFAVAYSLRRCDIIIFPFFPSTILKVAVAYGLGCLLIISRMFPFFCSLIFFVSCFLYSYQSSSNPTNLPTLSKLSAQSQSSFFVLFFLRFH